MCTNGSNADFDKLNPTVIPAFLHDGGPGVPRRKCLVMSRVTFKRFFDVVLFEKDLLEAVFDRDRARNSPKVPANKMKAFETALGKRLLPICENYDVLKRTVYYEDAYIDRYFDELSEEEKQRIRGELEKTNLLISNDIMTAFKKAVMEAIKPWYVSIPSKAPERSRTINKIAYLLSYGVDDEEIDVKKLKDGFGYRTLKQFDRYHIKKFDSLLGL